MPRGDLRPQKRALLIGINYAGTRNELRGCINDARNVQSLLESRGWSCTLMVDESNVKRTLFPSRENILRELVHIIQSANAGDELFFHYSGHGTHTRDTSGDEADGRDEALCPARGGSIVDDELRLITSRLRPGCSLMMLLDCCHSGTGADLRYNCSDASQYVGRLRRIPDAYSPLEWTHCHTTRENTRYGEMASCVLCISGCADTQTSADTVFDNQACGAMTASFLKGWAALSTPAGTVPVQRLVQYMACMLRCYRYAQQPQLSIGRKREADMYNQNTLVLAL